MKISWVTVGTIILAILGILVGLIVIAVIVQTIIDADVPYLFSEVSNFFSNVLQTQLGKILIVGIFGGVSFTAAIGTFIYGFFINPIKLKEMIEYNEKNKYSPIRYADQQIEDFKKDGTWSRIRFFVYSLIVWFIITLIV